MQCNIRCYTHTKFYANASDGCGEKASKLLYLHVCVTTFAIRVHFAYKIAEHMKTTGATVARI